MLHGSPDLFVCETVTADQLADFRVRVAVLAVQVQDAGEVARITDIHRIGDSRNGGTRRVNPRVQVFQEHVVAVVGSHETFDWQPHPMCKQTSCDIAEVSTGDGYHQLVRFAYFIQLRIRVEVVERLRKETCHIDGVG